jgi:DNA-binding XRE family transcriptional regulator
MIYFIENSETKHIKIGFSSDIRRRLVDLQISSPHELKVLTICEGDDKYEKELHKRFYEYRYRGEWFLPNKELNNFIESFPPYKNIEQTNELKRLRRERKMSLEDVGRKMKISKQAVMDTEKRFEEGTLTINTLKNYLKAVGYDYSIIFSPK